LKSEKKGSMNKEKKIHAVSIEKKKTPIYVKRLSFLLLLVPNSEWS